MFSGTGSIYWTMHVLQSSIELQITLIRLVLEAWIFTAMNRHGLAKYFLVSSDDLKPYKWTMYTTKF